jgi:hypothetical protein
MTNTTRITLAAALIAAFASPALARDSQSYRHHARQEQSAQYPQFFEGRNAAVTGNSATMYGEPLVPDRTTALGN